MTDWQRLAPIVRDLMAQGEANLARLLALAERACSPQRGDAIDSLAASHPGQWLGMPIDLPPYLYADFFYPLAVQTKDCDAICELDATPRFSLFQAWLRSAPQDADYIAALDDAVAASVLTDLASCEPGLRFHHAPFTFSQPDLGFLAQYQRPFIISNRSAAASLAGLDTFHAFASLPGQASWLLIEEATESGLADRIAQATQSGLVVVEEAKVDFFAFSGEPALSVFLLRKP